MTLSGAVASVTVVPSSPVTDTAEVEAVTATVAVGIAVAVAVAVGAVGAGVGLADGPKVARAVGRATDGSGEVDPVLHPTNSTPAARASKGDFFIVRDPSDRA